MIKRPTEQGLTLVEALAAIVIFGLSITAVTAPLMLSMATRVRAHRAQQAMQLAQGEIDRVRLLLERGDINNDLVSLLPPDGGNGEAIAVGYRRLPRMLHAHSLWNHRILLTQQQTMQVNGV